MIHDRSTFESTYAGQAPWDIGKPQKPFVDMADQITGTVLDAGCGTGDTALFIAGRGCHESKKELHAAFAQGWSIESVEATRAEVRHDLKDLTFSEGGPKAWLVVAKKVK
jgi:SAM-dependent methyltransferase